MLISLLLPVVSSMSPNLLLIAISVTPRMRDCRFSSVISGARLPKAGASILWKASIAGPIGTVS